MNEQWYKLAQSRTVLMAVGFLVSVLVLVLSVGAGVQLAAYGLWIHNPTADLGPEYVGLNPFMWSPILFALVVTLMVPSIFFGTAFKLRQLKSGFGPLLTELGARLVEEAPIEPSEQALRAIVVEFCEVAKVPLPYIVILEGEPCINAFTVGTPGVDAVLGVTGGAMTILNSDQLRSLVAHEVSLLLHGDSIVNTRIAGVLHGLLLVEFAGLYLASKGTGQDEDGEPRKGRLDCLVPGFILMIIGFPGSICARVIKLLLCRKSIAHADAVIVEYFGGPNELVGLLKRIGALRQQSFLHNPRAEMLSQCFFAAPTRRLKALDILSVAPSLPKRIRRWQPEFDGVFIPIRQTRRGLAEIMPDGSERPLAEDGQPVRKSAAEVVHEKPPENPIAQRKQETKAAAAMAAVAAADAAAPPPEEVAPPPPVSGRNAAPAIVRIESTAAGLRLLYPETLLEQLPGKVREMAGNSSSAQAMLMCMLLAEKHKLRENQLRHLATINDPATHLETLSVARALEKLPKALRLTVAEMASSGIRQLVAEEYALFRENIQHLLTTRDPAEKQQAPFFFAIDQIVIRGLDAYFSTARPEETVSNGVSPERLVAGAAGAFAYLSAEKPEQLPLRLDLARGVVTGGHDVLDGSSGPVVFSVEILGDIMAHLAETPVEVRESVIVACVKVATEDNLITLQEAELIRAIAASLRIQIGLALAPSVDEPQPSA